MIPTRSALTEAVDWRPSCGSAARAGFPWPPGALVANKRLAGSRETVASRPDPGTFLPCELWGPAVIVFWTGAHSRQQAWQGDLYGSQARYSVLQSAAPAVCDRKPGVGAAHARAARADAVARLAGSRHRGVLLCRGRLACRLGLVQVLLGTEHGEAGGGLATNGGCDLRVGRGPSDLRGSPGQIAAQARRCRGEEPTALSGDAPG